MESLTFHIIYVISEEEEILQEEEAQSRRSLVVAATPGVDAARKLSAQDMLEALAQSASEGGMALRLQIFDCCCTEKTRAFGTGLAEKYDSIVYLESPGKTVLQCWNEGLADTQPEEWVSFMRASALYKGSLFGKIAKYIQSKNSTNRVVCLAPYQFRNNALTEQLYYKRRNQTIIPELNPYHLNYCPDSAFILRSEIGGIRFREELHEDEACVFFMTELLESADSYYIMKERCYIRKFLPNDGYNYSRAYEKDWYAKAIREEIRPFLLENPKSPVRQATAVYLTELKFFANADGRNKELLEGAELQDFLDAVSELFRDIDDEILVQYRWGHRRMLQRFMGVNFLRMKYHDYDMEGHLETKDERRERRRTGTPALNPNTGGREPKDGDLIRIGPNAVIGDQLRQVSFQVRAINYEKGELLIDGELVNVYFARHDRIRLWVECGEQCIEAEMTGLYGYSKYFGLSVKKGYMAQIRVPEELFAQGGKLKIFMEFEGYVKACRCSFVKIQARLTDRYKKSYWKFGNYLLRYEDKLPGFRIACSSFLMRLRYERAFLKEVHSWKALALRAAYFVTAPFFRRRNVWLTFDQLFKGGDNGEYFFRYVNENHRKDADLYYVINPDAKEYAGLKKKYGHVLKYPSPALLLLSLHAKIIFATRADVKLYCGYKSWAENYIRDLFNADVVCLQHGLTIQKIAQYQNRLFDNLKFYFCVSPVEVRNIENPLYGYTPDQIRLTGAPRYDGLTGTPKRQILITPTWRRNVTAGTNTKGSNHEYSVNFRHTEYFRIYNTLINDGRLIACARKTGYKLIYLIHPILSPQIGDFDRNEYVEIVPGVDVNYETILKESSLMVTDYSGVQFDFAYMRRPLIYYHPDELPPQYEPGIFHYEEMGFGPVCRNHDEVVDALCRYMENNCALEETYRERIESFFPFADQENCRRVYETAVEYQKNH